MSDVHLSFEQDTWCGDPRGEGERVGFSNMSAVTCKGCRDAVAASLAKATASPQIPDDLDIYKGFTFKEPEEEASPRFDAADTSVVPTGKPTFVEYLRGSPGSALFPPGEAYREIQEIARRRNLAGRLETFQAPWQGPPPEHAGTPIVALPPGFELEISDNPPLEGSSTHQKALRRYLRRGRYPFSEGHQDPVTDYGFGVDFAYPGTVWWDGSELIEPARIDVGGDRVVAEFTVPDGPAFDAILREERDWALHVGAAYREYEPHYPLFTVRLTSRGGAELSVTPSSPLPHEQNTTAEWAKRCRVVADDLARSMLDLFPTVDARHVRMTWRVGQGRWHRAQRWRIRPASGWVAPTWARPATVPPLSARMKGKARR